MDKVKSRIGFKQVPHFTTLQKFITRLSSIYFAGLLKQTLKIFYSHVEIIEINAIDQSEFTDSYCSYYSWRTEKKRRYFLKTSISVDTSKICCYCTQKLPICSAKTIQSFLGEQLC